MGFEAVKLLINEIDNGTSASNTEILIDEEFLWRKSVKQII